MITEKEYLEAKRIVDIYETQQSNGGGVTKENKDLYIFCRCQKPWGVNGMCVACEMPIRM